jgi:hypothetical protein
MACVENPAACGPEGATDFQQVTRSFGRFAGWSFRRSDGSFSWMAPSGWYDESGATIFPERERAEAQLLRLAKEPEKFGFGDTVSWS